MSTGDLRNNLYKLQSKLKKIEFPGYLNCISLGKGDPESFLPLFHYILLDAFPLLADYFASKGYNLYGKKDVRFVECVYKLLRDEFTYKPAITREQFFSLGFSERKIILTCDIIDMYYYMDGEFSNTQEGVYQNELDGVMQYPPSRFLKPAWNEERNNIKTKENNSTFEEPNYYEEYNDNDYSHNEPQQDFNRESDCNLIDGLSSRITELELKVENSLMNNKNLSQTENNIMKIKNIIEKEKSLKEEDSTHQNNISASLIQEQCIAEEVPIEESISSKPSISVQRSSYSQSRYSNSDSLEFNKPNMNTSKYDNNEDNEDLIYKINHELSKYIHNIVSIYLKSHKIFNLCK
ncbi:hypothetical protein BCR36DRAFT_369215 [Piromyces finnis]|uniref:Centrosomal protein of 44 kDa n=1 Tax=Piromyces finnis TaxID=1754191 RepID=A0A1Y1VCQ3_9FUNG|nr:hypothetical protein BCR36DRAFT_369215 [Piromyces finnis]|eukprot:ORX52957.1 hypothetical protein BCR36DRAFT_369215 [Piromyces finnis]